MAYATKYQWTISARRRTWNVALQEEGFVGSATTLTGGRGARIIWSETTADLDARIMPADMRLQVYDPDLTLYNELSAAGVEEDDYRIILTDSTGTYTMRFRVRLDTVRTALFGGLDVHITSLYAYCGLANLKTIDAVTLTSSTLHNTVRYLLVSNVMAQDIEYVAGVYPENVNATGAVLDLVRLNRMDLTYQEEGRKRDNAESQLRGLLEALDAAMWQGMDGQWHVKHRFALGEYVTGRGPQRYIHASTSLVALSTLQLPIYQARAAVFNRGATVRTDEPIQAVEIEQGVFADERFTDVNLVRFADMEAGWVSDTEHLVWQGGPSVIFRSTDSDTGTYSLQINPDATPTIRQDLVYIAGKQPLRFILNIRFGHVYTSGGSGSGVSKVRLVWDPYDAAGAPRYATSSGWSTTPTDYTLTQTPQTFGSPVNWTTETIEIVDSVPGVDALLYIQFTGDTTSNFVVRIDNVEVRLVDEGQATENSFRAVFHRLDNNTNPATKGIVVQQRRPWHPGTLWLDTDANDLRDTAVQLVQADTTGSGGWVEAADWSSEIEGDSPTYDDLARWSAESRIEQQQDPLEVIEGEILDIIPPELAVVYSGGVYMPLYCELDLVEERTRLVLAKKQRAYESLEAPDPFTTMYVAIENNEVGATNNFVAKVLRDEANVGSWTYQLVNISQSTYGTNLNSLACIEVDEAANRIFLVFDSEVMYSFELDGTPVAQVWSVAPGSTFQGFTIDTASDRLYIMSKAADNRTLTLTSYDYTGGDAQVIWTQTFGSATGCVQLAYAGGFVYFTQTVAVGTDALVRVNVSSGVKSNVIAGLSLVSSVGQGAVHEGQFWFGADTADTSLRKATVPTASTYATHDDHASFGTNGVAVDTVGLMVYWVTSQLTVTRSAYDGSGEANVVQFPAGTGTLIYGLSFGK